MKAAGLREWRGVKPVAAPSGAAAVTRLRTTPADDAALDQVARLLGSLRRGDLAAVSRPVAASDRRAGVNARKTAITAQSSSRWAGTIIGGSAGQYRLARRAQAARITTLNAAITAIEARLAAPASGTLTVAERKARRKARLPKGYATQAERFGKQRRVQHLKGVLARVEADYDTGVVRVTEGGRRLLRTRGNLPAAGITEAQWREQWDAARWRVEANGSKDEPHGNLTITVTPGGIVSLRLPKLLEHLANAPRGRYVLSGQAVFAHRAAEWHGRVTSGQSVSYALTRKPGRAGAYLTASWGYPAQPEPAGGVRVEGPVIGVDLNDGHLAVRRLDHHGNPTGRPLRIGLDLTGPASRRDAQVRHAVTRLARYARRHGINAIAVEDLDFADARDTGRETMGRGARGRRFRRTVAGIPTSVFRARLTGMAAERGIRLYAVNPAYTSTWGGQHWQAPYNVTRHEAAATVIGRRAQGHKARRREGVTLAPPADEAVRATNQAGPGGPAASGSRPRARTRGPASRPPARTRTRLPRRATVTPAQLTHNGQHQT